MAIEQIDIALLSNVIGGAGEGAEAAAVTQQPRVCTASDPMGRGPQPPQRYWENRPPGSDGGHGHGGGGHQPHLDPPVHIRRPPPWRPTITRSDRRLKRRIRTL